jgi:hypothetical protein
VRHVRRRNQVREIAERYVAAPDVTVDNIQPLVETLIRNSGWRWRERRLAAWLLGHIGAATAFAAPASDALVRVVERKVKRDYAGALVRTYIRTIGVLLALLLFWVVADPSLIAWMADAHGTMAPLLANGTVLLIFMTFSGLLFPVVCLPSKIVEDLRTNAVRKAAVDSLGKLAEPATLGAIAVAATGQGALWWSGTDTVCSAASEALPKVVANLRPEHYGALPPGAVTALCKLVGCGDGRAVRASLDALRVIGDGSAVQPVARAAERATNPAIRAAAEELLPILLERQRNEMAPAVLLRPSSAPTVASDELLRPAASGNDTNPEELLRASTGEADPGQSA